VAWNPNEANILLTGSHDGSVAVLDVKTGKHRSWAVEGEIECIAWDPHMASRFFVTTDGGSLSCFNLTVAGGDAVWTMQVHRKSASALAVNPHIRNFVATGSEDKTFALWDVSGAQPIPLHRRPSPTVGCRVCVRVCMDVVYVYVCVYVYMCVYICASMSCVPLCVCVCVCVCVCAVVDSCHVYCHWFPILSLCGSSSPHVMVAYACCLLLPLFLSHRRLCSHWRSAQTAPCIWPWVVFKASYMCTTAVRWTPWPNNWAPPRPLRRVHKNMGVTV
jgi:hypothetical protein